MKDNIVHSETKQKVFEYIQDKLLRCLNYYTQTGLGLGEYHKPRIFDDLYQLTTFHDVIKAAVEYMDDCEIINEHVEVFKFDKGYFFNELHIEYTYEDKSSYIKDRSTDDILYLKIKVYDKPVEMYYLEERRFYMYDIMYEITKAYEEHLLRLLDHNTVIELMTSNKMNKIISDSIIDKCDCFLNENKRIAYMENLKKAAVQSFKRAKPTVINLDLSKIINVFSNEVIFNDYVEMYLLMEAYDLTDNSKKFNLTDLKDKWKQFKEDYIRTFIEAYSEYEIEMPIGGWICADTYGIMINDPFYMF